ncbi:hypothetical protein EVAR_82968_1 [Eumeta japonica]|uniref:Uncharacterized protein n=1 Tax=Eumeta variegata TaxID=151549 RepID=A0A4C1VPG6_EUMVA|nr:hypothetical protein EVAR_82968_1 [Eumeta japonica]
MQRRKLAEVVYSRGERGSRSAGDKSHALHIHREGLATGITATSPPHPLASAEGGHFRPTPPDSRAAPRATTR